MKYEIIGSSKTNLYRLYEQHGSEKTFIEDPHDITDRTAQIDCALKKMRIYDGFYIRMEDVIVINKLVKDILKTQPNFSVVASKRISEPEISMIRHE